MKKLYSLLILIFLFIITSCNGLQKTNSIWFDSIYDNERITMDVKDVKLNPGLSLVGGTEYYTKKSEDDALLELKENGVTIQNITYGDYKFIQINNKGLYSLETIKKDNRTGIIIHEMSISFDTFRFPFPCYSIYSDSNKCDFLYINPNQSFDNVDKTYTSTKIKEFNELTKIYTKIEETDTSINLYYNTNVLSLSFVENTLHFNMLK